MSRNTRKAVHKMAEDELPVSTDQLTPEDHAALQAADAKSKTSEGEEKGAKQAVRIFAKGVGKFWSDNHLGIQSKNLYGQRELAPFTVEQLERRAKFLGRPLTAEDLEELHGVDDSAPANTTCAFCEKPIEGKLVRSAIVDKDGDLFRDRNTGNVLYRGQFVVVGKPLGVHAAHAGYCIFMLRHARGLKKKVGRFNVPDLLPCHSYSNAENVLANINRRREERRKEQEDQKASFHNRLFGERGFRAPALKERKRYNRQAAQNAASE